MAKAKESPSSAPPQKYHVVAPAGRHVAGEIVTAEDLFPGVSDQAEIDALTRRLLALHSIVPHVEFATPEAPAVTATEVIAPIRVTPSGPASLDHEIVAPPAAPTFEVPKFTPPATA